MFCCLWSLAGAPEAALQFLLQPGLKELLTSSYLFTQHQHLDIITNYLFFEGFFYLYGGFDVFSARLSAQGRSWGRVFPPTL